MSERLCWAGRGLSRTSVVMVLVPLLVAVSGCGSGAVTSVAGAKPDGRLIGAQRGNASRGPLPKCTVYVAPRGAAPSAGHTANAPTTLSAAVARVIPGSVVCLEPGTYDTSTNIILSRSGTASAPVVLRNYRGTALIRYTGGSRVGGVLQTSSERNWRGAHDIVIEGLVIDGGDLIGGGIFVTQGAHNITIRNCVIRDTGATGLALNATDYVTVEHNLIYHVGYNQGYSSGISLWYGGPDTTYGGRTAWYDAAPGFHNIIADNTVAGTYDNSPHHSDGDGIIVDGGGSIPPVLIVNNLVYENGGRGIETYLNHGDIWVVNNTAYADGLDLRIGHGRASEFVSIRSSGVHFVNDLAYGRRQGTKYSYALLFNNAGSKIELATTIGYNGATSGIPSSTTGNANAFRYADPMFVSAPAVPSSATPWADAVPPWRLGDDFKLRAGSPALEGGANPIAIGGLTPPLAAQLHHYVGADR